MTATGRKAPPKHCKECPTLKYSIFNHLEEGALDNVSHHKIANTFKKGQNLSVQGNPSYGLYCVNQGKIKIAKVSHNGKETIVGLASQGDALGELSVFTGQYYSATATVMEDTTACFLDKEYITRFTQKEPSVAMNLITRLCQDIRDAEKRMTSFHQKNVRERLAELILILKEKYGTQCPNGKIRLDIKLTREEMASLIGTATETLIRFITELKEEGLIEQKGKILYIADTEGLVDYAKSED